ncbi:YoaK family protein [Rhodoferax saidenbachensis]|uniref:DUF1275 family protein n=1 Tax=Rhodoferax saidenbachensis TaxID=1484693 RepID=A0A1P8K9P5_9BURK|nr:YoaK family protein [Rhodoferax saidenbachensis]APW42705.1 DUF1275 family protein [Rhodoferax saidenbachensis]
MKLGWTDIQRSDQANRGLGTTLAFVAGAINAGGFLAVGTYTSHMTGVVSSVADNMVLGHWIAVLVGVVSLMAFVGGAMTTAWMVNWSLRRNLHSAFGRPLLLEAALLLVFGVFGSAINVFGAAFVSLTVLVLCFIMGLQNAVITKISHAEIRTTHVTGLVTDLGIELGKLVYINGRDNTGVRVEANRRKLGIHLQLIAGFFAGALCGALGFKWVGYSTTLPLALVLVLLAWRPVAYDFVHWWRGAP